MLQVWYVLALPPNNLSFGNLFHHSKLECGEAQLVVWQCC